MLYLDLGELDRVFSASKLFSARKKALAEFRRSDHFGDPGVSLDQAVRDLVEERGHPRPRGPIRLLTHLRYFGYVFNPVSFFYCFDENGEELETIVAEVNNTPWGERHCYVLPARNSEASTLQRQNGMLKFSPAKEMHVSPFMPMDIDYDWRFRAPGSLLGVHMTNYRHGEKVFDATLRLKKEALNSRSLAWSLAAYPFMTLKVITAIHWQALRLWIKKVPFIPHPSAGATRDPSIEPGARLRQDNGR